MKSLNPYRPLNLFVAILLLLAFQPVVTQANDRPQPLRTKVEVLQLFPRELKSYASYVGHLKPLIKVSISSEIAGVVEELNVDQGDKVEKSEILLQIDTRRQLLNSRLNKSNYELALKDYERENKLLEKRLSTPAKVANLKNRLEVNRLKLELSELDLVRSRIKAPINGVISQPKIEQGEYVKVGSNLLEILDISKVLAVINIPEREIRYLQEKKNAVLSVDALPGMSFAGKVKTIGLEADRKSRTFEVEIEVENPEIKLRPGMLVRARLLKLHLESQIVIPRHTIQEEEQGSFVYIVENDRIAKRTVTLGISINREIQVLSGLRFGDLLVNTGHQLVSPREAVEVVSLTRQK